MSRAVVDDGDSVMARDLRASRSAATTASGGASSRHALVCAHAATVPRTAEAWRAWPRTAAPAIPGAVTALVARPRAMAIAGALTIAFSAILVKQAGVSPSTRGHLPLRVRRARARRAGVVGGAAAGPAQRARPRAGGAGGRLLLRRPHLLAPRDRGRRAPAWPPCSATCRSPSSPLVAWLVLGERPAGAHAGHAAARPQRRGARLGRARARAPTAPTRRRASIYGLATGLAYTGFILVLRAGSGEQQRVAGPLFDATLVAALVATLAGELVIGDRVLVPSRRAHACGPAILALTSQVIGWLLISALLPRLPAAQTSLLLTIQPVGSVILGAILFAEAPSGLQLVRRRPDHRYGLDDWSRACVRRRWRESRVLLFCARVRSSVGFVSLRL